ncbi:hypothetical protein [Ralstonia phage RP31]|uniref:Uncharacterized protein n=2 Tax=Ripduovirus RP12 TaxID=2560700 RepID=A0A1L7N0U0_9CAUD|nr:hypothetical protein FDH28_gp113 [Ralstonia phage RP12]BAW19087.1 hypothetical protein [Ralstonia phage RP12]BAW19373.1 hypothetical protein [Ralstonia phage RP31]
MFLNLDGGGAYAAMIHSDELENVRRLDVSGFDPKELKEKLRYAALSKIAAALNNNRQRFQHLDIDRRAEELSEHAKQLFDKDDGHPIDQVFLQAAIYMHTLIDHFIWTGL